MASPPGWRLALFLPFLARSCIWREVSSRSAAPAPVYLDLVCLDIVKFRRLLDCYLDRLLGNPGSILLGLWENILYWMTD